MTEAAKKGTPMNFVYAGRRESTKGDILHEIYPIKEDGTLDKGRVYDKKAFGRHGKTIGAVYSGASFDAGTAYGLGAVVWKESYHDRAAVVGWEALDAETMQTLARRKMEREQRPVIEQELSGVRRMLYKLRKRGAHSEVHALRNLIDAELFRSPTEKEKDEWDSGDA